MYLALILAGTTAVTRTVDACGITFDLPHSWSLEIEDDPRLSSCGVVAAPPGWADVRAASERDIPRWAIGISVVRRRLEELCKNEMLCTDGARWYFGPVPTSSEVYPSPPATEVRTRCCRAFKGFAGGHRIYLKDRGSVEGTIVNPHAIVVGTDRVAIVTEDEACEVGSGDEWSRGTPVVFNAVVETLRFK